MYGRHHSEESIQKMREKTKGRTFTGKRKHSSETKSMRRKNHLAEKNPMWKGDLVGSYALHMWVKSLLPKPKLCQKCNKIPPYDLANATNIYNRELKNWIYLCRRCHMISDGRMNNLKQYR